MDFFAAQELRRRKTKWLVFLYLVAIVAIILGIYVVIAIALGAVDQSDGQGSVSLGSFFNPGLFAIVAAVNLLVIGGASLSKIAELRSGGQHIASMMGGTRVPPSTQDPAERRLLNVVEEMALASGISVPPVYIMNHEPGINAFAAGYSPADAVIGVNRGTIEQLNRDELQGVIAHEFSHILNGDMRLNIRLIGILFGIQMLATIGYFALRFSGGGRHSRRDGENKGAGAIIAIAIALLVFGSIGQFFARWIKASVSREREYLADASAVQFTRYPDGLGGALKLIGATHTGSAIESESAEQLSHMFFASHLSSSMFSLFATHPPLVNRIQKIDHEFKGDFKGYFRVRQEKARARALARQQKKREAEKSQSSPLGKMFPAEIAEKFSIDPAMLLAAIGAPSSRDVSRSRALLEVLPDDIVVAARHPYSARCVAFAMLASDSGQQRDDQLRYLEQNEGARTLETVRKLLSHVESLHLMFRLPVMEMIQGSLADLSPQQYQQFRATVEALVQLDKRTSLFEFVVRHHLLMHLDRRFEFRKQPRIRFKRTADVASEIELLLSAFASASEMGSVLQSTTKPDPNMILQSYRLAMQVAGFGDASQSTATLKQWEVDQLERCMLALHQSAPEVKKRFLHAAAVLITFDHEITIVESEFFRAVAESLDCPVPMLAAGRTRRAKVT